MTADDYSEVVNAIREAGFFTNELSVTPARNTCYAIMQAVEAKYPLADREEPP